MNALVTVAADERAGPITKHPLYANKCVEAGKRLLDAIEQAGITQSELSRILGVSRSAVSLWVKGGAYPNHDLYEPLAAILHTTQGWLAFGEKPLANVQYTSNSYPIPVRDRAKTTTMSIPASLVAQELFMAGKLTGVTVYPKDSPSMIAIADESDKVVTDAPRMMLVDYRGHVSPRIVNREGEVIIMTDDERGTVDIAGDADAHILGHMVARFEVEAGV